MIFGFGFGLTETDYLAETSAEFFLFELVSAELWFGQKNAKKHNFCGSRLTVGVPATTIFRFKRAQRYFWVSHIYCQMILGKKMRKKMILGVFLAKKPPKTAKKHHFWGSRLTVGVPATTIFRFKVSAE